MPVVDDNTLSTRHRGGYSLVVQCDDADGTAVFAHHRLDGYLAEALAANSETSAAILAQDGDTLIYSGLGEAPWPASAAIRPATSCPP
jgi:hypothetical protein